jgi:hypothetical protein
MSSVNVHKSNTETAVTNSNSHFIYLELNRHLINIKYSPNTLLYNMNLYNTKKNSYPLHIEVSIEERKKKTFIIRKNCVKRERNFHCDQKLRKKRIQFLINETRKKKNFVHNQIESINNFLLNFMMNRL